MKDANGNLTYYGYTAFGAIAWEIQPPPHAGAARPLRLYGYEQKSAAIRTGSAGFATGAPIWTRTSEVVCQSPANTGTGRPGGTPTCDMAAPVQTTAYEFGADGTPDNLLVRGVAVSADGVTRRTCYGYDGLGNRISETKPRAGLAVCS